MESHITFLVLFLACVCAVSAAPVSSRREQITRLVTLLGKIRDIERIRNSAEPLTSLDITNSARDSSDFPIVAHPALSDSFENEDSPKQGILGKSSVPVKKRQGAWSYDYGLGGGRFGKRHYGDYGIGGGRFGRDVDHVDLSDGSDADLVS